MMVYAKLITPIFFRLIICNFQYKRPCPTEADHSKSLENRTSKYRLPFKKDEPTEHFTNTFNILSQHNISLQPELKFPKLAMHPQLNKPTPSQKA